jgi:hypothetical protein
VSHDSLAEEKSEREEKLGLGGGRHFLKGAAAWSSRRGVPAQVRLCGGKEEGKRAPVQTGEQRAGGISPEPAGAGGRCGSMAGALGRGA